MTIEEKARAVAKFKKQKARRERREQIAHGIDSGLTPEQIALYSRPEFDRLQMDEIRRAFEFGLTTEEVKTFAKPELSWFEMMNRKNEILAARG